MDKLHTGLPGLCSVLGGTGESWGSLGRVQLGFGAGSPHFPCDGPRGEDTASGTQLEDTAAQRAPVGQFLGAGISLLAPSWLQGWEKERWRGDNFWGAVPDGRAAQRPPNPP